MTIFLEFILLLIVIFGIIYVMDILIFIVFGGLLLTGITIGLNALAAILKKFF